MRVNKGKISYFSFRNSIYITYLVSVNGVLYESGVFVMGKADVVKEFSLPLHGPNQIIGTAYFVLRTTGEFRWLINVNFIGFGLQKNMQKMNGAL